MYFTFSLPNNILKHNKYKKRLLFAPCNGYLFNIWDAILDLIAV